MLLWPHRQKGDIKRLCAKTIQSNITLNGIINGLIFVFHAAFIQKDI